MSNNQNPIPPVTDIDLILTHCRAWYGITEITDACARVIAAQFHAGAPTASYAFLSTGALTTGASQIWREMFVEIHEDDWEPTSDERVIGDMMGSYLVARERAGNVGPVAGWASLWLTAPATPAPGNPRAGTA